MNPANTFFLFAALALNLSLFYTILAPVISLQQNFNNLHPESLITIYSYFINQGKFHEKNAFVYSSHCGCHGIH